MQARKPVRRNRVKGREMNVVSLVIKLRERTAKAERTVDGMVEALKELHRLACKTRRGGPQPYWW